MLTELRVENFRSFGREVRAPLAPLTLVFGPNSGGKTSLLSCLGLLAQSDDAVSVLDPPHLTQGLAWNGRFVDLGSFTAAVHHHNVTSTMRISLSGEHTLDTGSEVAATANWAVRHMPRANRVVVENVTLRQGDRVVSFDWRTGVTGASGRVTNDERRDFQDYYTVSDSDDLLNSYRARVALFPWMIRDAPKDLRNFMTTCRFALGTTRDPIYLGPLRHRPDRFAVFERGSAKTSEVEPSLALLAADPELLELVNEWLYRLGMHYTVHFDAIPFGRQGSVGEFLIMTLTDTRSGTQVSTTDVGFGVSQVLPIVISLVANKRSRVFIEQPEVHLHPRLQASLGDLIIQSLRQGNQLFLETHSEHLMLRLMALVREGAIHPSSISTLYVLPGERGEAAVRHLRLDSDGDFIDQWPGGFFDERQDLLGW